MKPPPYRADPDCLRCHGTDTTRNHDAEGGYSYSSPCGHCLDAYRIVAAARAKKPLPTMLDGWPSLDELETEASP